MLYEEQKLKDGQKVIVVMIEGGIGDSLLATPMLRGMRIKYPKEEYLIIVMAMYHEVYGIMDMENPDGDHIIPLNPNIDRLYSMRIVNSFYKEYGRLAHEVFRQNPYLYSPQRLGPKHMAEIWCSLHNVPFDNLYLDFQMTEFETQQANQLYTMSDNPVVVIHPFGGNDPVQRVKKTTNKDWEHIKWQQTVDYLVNRGYDVIQIGYEDEHVFNKVISFVGHTTIREAIGIISKANFIISIDSFAIHAAKALGVSAIVLWGRTNPFKLGYPDHYNIFKLQSCAEIFCGRPEGALFDLSSKSTYFTPWECPHHNCMKALTLLDIMKGVATVEKRLDLSPTSFVRQPSQMGVPDNCNH